MKRTDWSSKSVTTHGLYNKLEHCLKLHCRVEITIEIVTVRQSYIFKMAAKAEDNQNATESKLMSRLLESQPADGDQRSPPTLDDCIQQIVSSSGPRMAEENMETIKMAARFTEDLVCRVRSSSVLWRRYTAIPGLQSLGETTVLYKQDFGSFVCHVHLERPTRMGAFVFEGSRLPSLYAKVKVNPRDSREQQMSVLHEWWECSDKFGYLRSDLILKWFNKDLLKAKKIMVEENSHWSVSHLVTANGNVLLTVTGHADTPTMSNVCFNVIFVPCLNWVKVSLGPLSLPTSHNDPFPQIKYRIQRMSRRDANRDRCPIILEACQRRHTQSDKSLWRLSLVKYEKEIYKILHGSFFVNHMSVLMESLVSSQFVCLSALTRQVLQQALVNLLEKVQYEQPDREALFVFLLEYLQRCFSTGYMRQSLLPSINRLMEMEMFEMKRTADGLSRVLKDIKKNPEMLLVYVGMCSRHDAVRTRLG